MMNGELSTLLSFDVRPEHDIGLYESHSFPALCGLEHLQKQDELKVCQYECVGQSG